MVSRQMLAYVSVALLMATSASAQYTIRWQQPSWTYMANGNTDSDPAEEYIFRGGSSNNESLMVVDGSTGLVEWTLPMYVLPQAPIVQDADADGRDEIIVKACLEVGGQVFWYCYDYTGGVGSQEPRRASPQDEPALGRSHPNPASRSVSIQYSLPSTSSVSLRVYDAAGRLVRKLQEGQMSCGQYTALWDCKDDEGVPIGAGSYFYQLEANGQTITRRMVTVR